MEENLVGYLLNSLDADTHNQVEASLKNSPKVRDQVAALRRALAPLAADREQPEPPADLVVRTLGLVAENICRELPRSPMPVTRPATVARPMWRRTDIFVAAGLLLAVLGLGIPAIFQLRSHHARIECQNNLRQFADALKDYHQAHKALPDFSHQAPHKVAGLIAPILRDAQVLPDGASMRCPANGAPLEVLATVEQIQKMTAEEFAKVAPRLLPCYAYSLGFKDKDGFHFPDRLKDPVSSLVPLMADRPPSDLTGNSTNHGGQGQNVLFQDGHVRFATTREVGFNRDDIYLNRDMKVGPGLDQYDAVLGSSASSFGETVAQP